MTIARYPSRLVLPQPSPSAKAYPSLLAYLCQRFDKVAPSTWRQRFIDGKVLDEARQPLNIDAPYLPNRTIYYFREVVNEEVIPFSEEIIYQDDELVVVDKPHFLPVTPGGRFVKQCLLYRLREQLGNDNIVPLHRLDRHTAGLVMFSPNPETRGCYGELFSSTMIEKRYKALAHYCPSTLDDAQRTRWRVENRIGRGEPWFLRRVVAGEVNARSTVRLVKCHGNVASFILQPHTGKTHQLRIHMSDLGFPIVNDRYYPQLLDEQADDYDRPLQLLAHELRFVDPVSGCSRHFTSHRKLVDGK